MKYVVSVSKTFIHRGNHKHKRAKKHWFVYYYDEAGSFHSEKVNWLQAMYLKTPVISSQISGIPELIDDGINGFLTEPGNVSEIAEKLDRLLSNKLLRIRMGEQALKKVKKEFNIEKGITKMIDAWQELL